MTSCLGLQGFTDLGDRMVRLKMNHFTFGQHAADEGEQVIQPGRLIAIEVHGRGGLEMRDNTDTTWEDVSLCTHGLAWASPELGEDRFVRWRGTRRRDTNR